MMNRKLQSALFLALCMLPQAAWANDGNEGGERPKAEVTWLGDAVFTARSAFYQVDPKSGELLLYISEVNGDCAAVRAAMGPNERAILIALIKPQQEVMMNGEIYTLYPVFMSGAGDMSAFASLIARGPDGQPMLDVPGGPIDMLDKETIGQHGAVYVKKDALASGTLSGDFDVYYGGASEHHARRALGSFNAQRCALYDDVK